MSRKKKSERKNANGEGSVWKDRNTFRWRLPVTSDEDGKPVFVGGNCSTREEAEIKLIQARADHSRGKLNSASGGKILFRDYAASYLKRPHGWAETTLRRYEVMVEYADRVLGDLLLKDIKPTDIRNLLTDLTGRVSQSRRNPGMPLGSPTINNALWTVRSILQDAVSDELIASNPALNIRLPRPGRHEETQTSSRVKVFTLDESRRFVELGHALHEAGLCFYWPALYAMLSVGLRRGEAAGLRWQDVDLEAGMLHIRQSRNFQKKITPPKTKSSRRSIPLPTSVRAMLESCPRDGLSPFSEGPRYGDPDRMAIAMKKICYWSDKGRLKEFREDCAHRAVVPEAGLIELIENGEAIPVLSPHALRHTYATLALRRGVPIEVVSKTLGHSRISMTYDVYRHVLEDEWRNHAVDLFAS